MSKLKYLLALIVIVFVGYLVYAGVTGHQTATFQVGADPADLHIAKVADNPLKRAKGLSGLALESLKEDGMLFIFDTSTVQSFTMKGMEFNLDLVWINNGKIMKIDKNVTAPVAGTPAQEVSSTPLKVDMVLELPAGKVNQYGYIMGQDIHINLDGAK
jgi:uncharacterized membrane protein (UPF0127 family)